MDPNKTDNNSPTDSPPRTWPNKWLIVATILIVAGLAIVLFRPVKNKPSSQPLPKYSASVSVAGSGFVPQILSVKPGTVVTWTNNDTGAGHQVAADPYPKNNSIPGFDSTVVLQEGDSYSFTFYNAGTYHVHDQMDPLKSLETIVVK